MSYETTVGYKDFINVIKRGKWIILLITLLATLTAALISYQVMKSTKPTYETKTSVIIGDNKDIVDAVTSNPTYEQMANSSTIAKNASVLLKGSVSAVDLQKSYEVLVSADAPILTITASGESQKQSIAIANSVTASFTRVVKVIYPKVTVKIMENSVQNDVVNNKFKSMYVILAFLLGLFLSVFIVTFVGFFDEKIRTKDDVEKYLGLHVLGNLPKRNKRHI